MAYTTLVDAATLQPHLADPDWLIVDVRHQLAGVPGNPGHQREGGAEYGQGSGPDGSR